MINTLLLISVVIFMCILLNKVSSKLGVPMLLAFILLGMFFGSDGIVKIPFDNYGFAQEICSIALIFIMFYGGFGTNTKAAKPVLAKSLLLSSLGVILTALVTGVFCHFVLHMDWLEGLLIGAVLSSTDAASVFSILRSKRLNLKDNTASLLEVESGSNDPFAYMLTAILIAAKNEGINGGEMFYLIFAQIVYGIVIGLLIALLTRMILSKITLWTDGFDAIFIFAIALLSYAAPSFVGGNGYLSTYIVGIILGNSKGINHKTLVPFFDGLTGLMQMLIFFLLGLLSFPSRLPEIMVPALFTALFLTFIARPAVVFLLLRPFGKNVPQQILVSWAGLRGAASIVFAVMAVMETTLANDIFHIVFCIVLFSILFQGSLLPYVSRRLNMIDKNSDVMKTFSDYSDEGAVEFIKFKITEEHPWCHMLVRDIILPPSTILVLLQREEGQMIPNGNTELLAGDRLILSAKSASNIEGAVLSEKEIGKGHKLIGLKISEIKKSPNSLIVMIQRGDKVVIPNGNTVIEEGDVLVFHRFD